MTNEKYCDQCLKYTRGDPTCGVCGSWKEEYHENQPQDTLTELKKITQANHDEVSNTYDYDGIAEGVFKRIAELEKPV